MQWFDKGITFVEINHRLKPRYVKILTCFRIVQGFEVIEIIFDVEHCLQVFRDIINYIQTQCL